CAPGGPLFDPSATCAAADVHCRGGERRSTGRHALRTAWPYRKRADAADLRMRSNQSADGGGAFASTVRKNPRARAPAHSCPPASGHGPAATPCLRAAAGKSSGGSYHATCHLVAFHRFEQRLEISFAKTFVAFALDDLEKYRADHRRSEDLQQ